MGFLDGLFYGGCVGGGCGEGRVEGAGLRVEVFLDVGPVDFVAGCKDVVEFGVHFGWWCCV